MKHILIVADGMADERQPALDGRTPLQYARTPAMDALARQGVNGLLHTVPAGYAPGSEIATLSLLGYEPGAEFEGRGVLEAAAAGVPLQPGDLVLRCNLVSLDATGKLLSHNAGGIGHAEGAALIACLQKKLGRDDLHFYPGLAYRHTLVVKGGNKAVRCTPPQDVRGEPADLYPVQALSPDAAATAQQLNALGEASGRLLGEHPLNRRRQAEGRLPANAVWFWSPGYPPEMESLADRYGFTRGAVVAGVPLIKGIGACAGLQIIDVPGATGYWDTDYAGKAAAAIRALDDHDFVLLHVEAPDECSHEGDLTRKITAIENIDRFIVGPLAAALQNQSEPYTVGLLPDHPSLCRTRAHTGGPVPFLLCGGRFQADPVTRYDEISAVGGACGHLFGDRFARLFFGR